MRQTSLNMVLELARRDERVVFIGSDPGAGTLDAMRREFPKRFFIEGVSEANVIGMAAGLAMEGFIPYVNTIATFLTRRCYEQVAVDLCLHQLPVRLLGSGGGFVYAPLGPTHQAIDDIAIMRALPGMTVIAVSDAEQMKSVMTQSLDWPGPIYVRLAKGGDTIVPLPGKDVVIGKAVSVRPARDVLLVCTGIMLQQCVKATDLLTNSGIVAGILYMHTLKPFDGAALLAAARGVQLVVTAEEHSSVGGLGSAVAETLADEAYGAPVNLLRLAIPDVFNKKYGSQELLLSHYGLDAEGIAARVLERGGAVQPQRQTV